MGREKYMTTKTYAILDPHANGPAEDIQNGGTVLTCAVDASDIHRLTRATEGFSSGQHYFEGTLYGEGDIALLASFGIVTALHPLSMYVGESAEGYGYKAGDGDIWNNNASIATVANTAKKVTLGCLLDADAGTVTFFVNNTAVATLAITASQTWYPAFGIGCTVAGDISWYAQFGANDFAFPQPGTPAWFTETTGLGTLFVCDQAGFITTNADTPANRPYDPAILNSDQFSIARKVDVWPWAAQNSGATYGDLSLDNQTGKFDHLLSADVRNARVVFRLVPVSSTTNRGRYSDSFVVGTALIDQVSTDTEAKLKISFQDPLVQLQRQLQTKKFPPYVDEGAAQRPVPITMGACRNVQPVLTDEEERTYVWNDSPITNIAVLREQGDPLDPYGNPPDYVPTADFAGVVLQVEPPGVVAGDVSNVGQQYIIPGASDVLAGAGLFTTWPNPATPPPGWTDGGSGTLQRQDIATFGAPQDYVAALFSTDNWNPLVSKFGKYIKSPTAILPAGKNVNITIKLWRCTGEPPPIGNRSYGLVLASALDDTAASSITPLHQPLQQPLFFGDDAYTLSYAVPAGADRFLYCAAAAASNAFNSGGVGQCVAYIYGIKVEVLADSVPDRPLQGITLTDYQKNAIETRAGLTAADWVQADTELIDTRTGYTYGNHTDDPIKIEDWMREPLDSSCSGMCSDHLGRARFRQLIAPETVADGDLAMELVAGQIQWPVNVSIDRADGLTTSAGVRKNNYQYQTSDFVSDTNATTGISQALRWQFMRAAQFLLTSTAPLNSFYDFANTAEPLITLLDDVTQGQSEINRVNAFYTGTRAMYTINLLSDEIDIQAFAELLFGDVVRVTYPRYGLDAGKKLFVVDTSFKPADLSMQLVLWG